MTIEFKEFKFQQNVSIEFIENNEVYKNKIFANLWFDSEKIKFTDGTIDELIDIQETNFYQGLTGGRMKDQVELFIQYYNINLLFQKSLLVKEVLIFNYLKK